MFRMNPKVGLLDCGMEFCLNNGKAKARFAFSQEQFQDPFLFNLVIDHSKTDILQVPRQRPFGKVLFAC